MSHYTPPKLNGHTVAYKGRRYWVIGIENDRPFEWITRDFGEYAIWDGALDGIIAWASKAEGGGFDLWATNGLYDAQFHCRTFKEFGPAALREGLKLFKDLG
jgi:hypothetical protein